VGVNRIVSFLGVWVAQVGQEALERLVLVEGDLDAGEDLSHVGTVVAVVKETHVPVPLEAIQELLQSSWSLRELKAKDPLIFHLPDRKRNESKKMQKKEERRKEERRKKLTFERPPTKYRA